MTNREYMAKLLADSDFIDDNGASYQSMVDYNIACPYFYGDKRSHCKKEDNYTLPPRWMCSDCKNEWLDSEVDE